MLTESHDILARWMKHFSQLLNVSGVNDIRQTEIHTAEPLVLDPSALDVELTIEKLKSHKSPGTEQIPAELFKLFRTIGWEIHKLINSISSQEELSEEWKKSILCLSIRRAI